LVYGKKMAQSGGNGLGRHLTLLRWAEGIAILCAFVLNALVTGIFALPGGGMGYLPSRRTIVDGGMKFLVLSIVVFIAIHLFSQSLFALRNSSSPPTEAELAEGSDNVSNQMECAMGFILLLTYVFVLIFCCKPLPGPLGWIRNLSGFGFGKKRHRRRCG
jgi:hypothetical protein